MDNRFLARGKRKDNGKWVVGGVCKTENWASIFVVNDYCGNTFEPPSCDIDEVDVIPETVGGCTGLTDKNDKLMFEGDRVIALFYKAGREIYMTGTVEWRKSTFSVTWDNKQYGRSFLAYINDVKVIGNIHDDNLTLNRADMPVPDDVSQPVLQPVFQPTTPENFEIMNG